MNTRDKLIEVKFNKKVWKKTKIRIIESILLFITLSAIMGILICICSAIENWCIEPECIKMFIACVVWLIGFAAYLHWVED